MNCKQGDLAVVVSAATTPEMIGCIVLIVRKAIPGEEYLPPHSVSPTAGEGWIVSVEGALIPTRPFKGARLYHLPTRFILDCHLRPLRDNPGQDETLQWAPVPKKVEA